MITYFRYEYCRSAAYKAMNTIEICADLSLILPYIIEKSPTRYLFDVQNSDHIYLKARRGELGIVKINDFTELLKAFQRDNSVDSNGW